MGRFLQRDTFPGIPERPQSLHRYTYAETNPARFTDQTGHSVDQYGHWTPGNLLPGQANTCTPGDFVDWWGSDDGDKFRTLTWTITTDFWDTLVWGPGDLAWGLVTDPGGTVYNVLVFPVTTLKNIAVGSVCGDPVMIGHGISGYAMLVYGPLKKSVEKPVPGAPKPPRSKLPWFRIGEEGGIANAIMQGILDKDSLGRHTRALKEYKVKIKYDQARNVYDPGSNTISFKHPKNAVPRGVFFEEMQHALDWHTGSAWSPLPIEGTPAFDLANTRIHIGTFRRIVDNQRRFGLTAAEVQGVLDKVGEWETWLQEQ